MLLRRVTTLTVLFSFLILLFSSVVLYIVPEGRVAYWADWRALLLDKHQWTNTHITVGLLFILSCLMHVVYNWRSMVWNIKGALSQQVKAPVPMLIALGITLLVFGGTLLSWQPMQQFVTWNEQIKVHQSNTYGSPPFAHAEQSTIGKFCQMMQLDEKLALEKLRAQNLKGDISASTTIQDIARANSMTPQQVYNLFKPTAADGDPFSFLPASPPEGTGKRKLSDFAAEFNLPMDVVLKKLADKGYEASANDTFHDVAGRYGLMSKEIYEVIRK